MEDTHGGTNCSHSLCFKSSCSPWVQQLPASLPAFQASVAFGLLPNQNELSIPSSPKHLFSTITSVLLYMKEALNSFLVSDQAIFTQVLHTIQCNARELVHKRYQSIWTNKLKAKQDQSEVRFPNREAHFCFRSAYLWSLVAQACSFHYSEGQSRRIASSRPV